LHKLTGRLELMFPGERNRKTPMSNNTILKALERMGYGGRMTGHGFRGLASTVLHEKGFDCSRRLKTDHLCRMKIDQGLLLA